MGNKASRREGDSVWQDDEDHVWVAIDKVAGFE